MENIIILVSGMPATGKTTFANWLSSEMRAPLVCYDHIKEKTLQVAKKSCENTEQHKLFGSFPYEFFLFSCEEIMKSSSLLIAEYFFSGQMKETLDDLMNKYQYKSITVHMDASTETAYHRFVERNQKNIDTEGIRPPDISYEKFSEFTKQNKDFRYGECFLYVDTNDFFSISFENIKKNILEQIIKVGETIR